MARPFRALPLIFLNIITCGSVAFATSMFWYCQEDWGLYKNGSTYQSNLKQLVTSLASNALKSGGFYNDTVGVGSPDQVYGLIMCYADASSTDCKNCLMTSASEVSNLSICGYKMAAAIQYDSCLLHYSNQSFFSVAKSFQPSCLQQSSGSNSPGQQQQSNADLTGPDFLNSSSVQSLISRLTTDASLSDIKYASGETNYMGKQFVYGLVQCTRDLKADECTKCVKNYIEYANEVKPNCSDQQGAKIMGPSCYIRYDLYPFDVASYTVPSPPPQPALAPSTSPVPPALSPSKSAPPPSVHGSKSSISIIIVSVSVTAGLLLLSAALFLLWRRRGRKQNRTGEDFDTNLEHILNPSAEYQVFDLDTLRNATHNFSDRNKLGQGGFGPVYKGTLTNGQEMAVKRLSGSSAQGLRELKNEVEFLAKLKHKNLVQLLGCCIQKKESILCYEFLPNGSLDKILFEKDSSKRSEFGWKLRYKIIEGIARGLHYLHKESRLKIIHRDLKASNILLDKYMSPKISDFGLARFFGEDQTHVDTSVIAGTFGYMAPEYVMYGNFSEKSDAYSFGVLLLETVMGQKNGSLKSSGQAVNIINHASQHWKNNAIDELKDPMLEDVYLEEITKCVNIALLCVQEEPNIRPNMEAVNRMLGGGAIPNLPSDWRVPLMDTPMSKKSSIAMRSSLSRQSSGTKTTRESLE